MAFLAVSSVAGFNASYHDSNGDECLVTSHDHAPLGKTSRVNNTRECTVHVLLINSAVSSVAGFNASYHDSNGDQCLVTSHVKLFDHAPLGKTSRVRIIVDNTRDCTVHVLLIN